MGVSEEEEFFRYSNPHSWLLLADDLYDQAVLIMEGRGQSHVTRPGEDGTIQLKLDRADRAVILLPGFAIENVPKGMALFCSPEHLKDARLSKAFVAGHNLNKLADASGISLNEDERKAIAIVSEGPVSWASYPCAPDLARSKDVPNIDEKMLGTLLRIFKSVRMALMKRLESGWYSHPGLYAKFKFSDGF